MSTPPSTPTPPATTPNKSRWGRMGGVMRRASTVLTLANSRPGTPSQERDSDSASLKRTSSRPDVTAGTSQPRRSNSSSSLALPIESTPPLKGMPTPIAESPAREEQAMQREQVVGPSPLAQAEVAPAAVTESPAPIDVQAKPEDSAQAAASAPSPTGYVPPPVIDSTAGNPGAFTDDPEALPQPIVVVDPYAAPKEEVVQPMVEEVKEEPKIVEEPTAAEEPTKEEPVPEKPQEEKELARVEEVQAEVQPEEQVDASFKTQIVPVEKTPSYFDKPMVESLLDFEMDSPQPAMPTPEFVEAVVANTALEPVAKDEEVLEHEEAASKPSDPEFRTQVEAAAVPAIAVLAEPLAREQVEAKPQAPAAVPSAEPAEVHAQVEPQVVGEAASYYRGDVQGMPIPEPHVPDIYSLHDQTVSPEHLGQREQDIWGGFGPNSSIQNGHTEVKKEDEEERVYAAVMPIPIPSVAHVQEVEHDESPSSMPNPHPEPAHANEDPFADPVIPIMVTHPEVSQPHPQMPEISHEEAKGNVVVMPLPAFHEVIPSSSIHRVPSISSSIGGGARQANQQLDERTPLLSNKKRDANGHGFGSINATHPHTASHAPTPANHSSISPIVFGNTAASPWNAYENQHHPKLHEYGWLEYRLPDGSVYYVHPTRRLTTDVDLRSERMLMAVEKWVDEKDGENGGFDGDGLGGLRGGKTINVGVEGWLKEAKSAAGGQKKPAKGQSYQPVFFERFWVDHIRRTVVRDEEEKSRGSGYVGRGMGYGSSAKGKASVSSHAKKSGAAAQEEDVLDQEYRYWSFMEAYPAHSPLPARAKEDALDVLTWAWTDGLLPSHRAVPAPFTKAECQELLSLLKSFQKDNHHHNRGLHQEDHGIETRVIARILLRVAHWRQTYFRPNKPLPQDVSHSRNVVAPYLQRPRRNLGGILLEVVVSCLFLGIPYLFYHRHQPRLLSGMGVTSGGAGRFNFGMDPELGALRTGGSSGSSMVVVGACTCLVAAIVLSGSVTFLNLPGLDGIARTASVVATLFAAASIAATALVVLRSKTDGAAEEEWAERLGAWPSSTSSQGILNTTTLTQSLPLVLLAYGLMAFVASIVLFVFRGQGAGGGHGGGGKIFDDFMRWTVMVVGGGIVGVVAMFWAVVMMQRSR
ncbi:hypothetical protein CPC08DRAFT_768163 [Agrocybe pediades]|nr:hypothetical protein CPC08DRAFT_768163 [Agrocybe pediades]